MICQKCGSENAAGSKFCTNCSAPLQGESNTTKTKKPVYKKWWFWVIAVFVVIAAFSTGIDKKADTKDKDIQTVEETKNTAETNNGLEQTTDAGTKDDSPSITMGQKNALRSAKAYLETIPFSHDGLVEQLEYEGYSHEEAIYGADNCGADWNEQAAKSAEAYLDMMAFSRDGLIEQLEYEGYSHEQAVYGAEANGY